MDDKGRDTPEALSAAAIAAPEPIAEPPRRRSGPHKRKAAAANSGGASPFSPPSKRAAREKYLHHQTPLPPLHNGPLTRARQSPNKFAGASAVPSNPLKTPDPFPRPPLPASDAPLSASEALAAASESPPADPMFDAEFEAIRAREPSVHVVPTFAGWFSWTQIHPIEERALPSFFNRKSEERTRELYMEIRNEIMKNFHSDPQAMIEPKHLSEMSAGDADARQEVMEFLDHWGLINFHPFPPSKESGDAVGSVDEEKASKAATLAEKLFQFEVVQPQPVVKPNIAAPVPARRLLREAAVVDELARPEGPSVEYHCNSCSADCSRRRYHCQTQADFDLCSECYNNGNFDSGMAPSDFILMEHAEVTSASGGSWTDQETLLLLEALELYGENWNEIAEHVATKTRAQCILHFVQMPIEDSFLDGKDDESADVLDNNADPNPIDKGSSDSKVEKTDTKTKDNEQQSVSSPSNISKLKEDGSKETVGPSSACKDTSVGPAVESSEIESATNKEQTLSSTSNVAVQPKDADKVEVSQEVGVNFAVNALKAAFQAMGSLPTPGGPLSFAAAGNPVMALAAFLAATVEPEIAAASVRCSLKSLSEYSPNIHLAARHCFILEDPPSEGKDPPASDSAVTDMVDGETQKDRSTSALKESDGVGASTDTVSEKETQVAGNESKDNVQIPASDDSALPETTPGTTKEAENRTLPGEVATSTVKETSDSAIAVENEPKTNKGKQLADGLSEEVSPSSAKQLGGSASQGEAAPSAEVTGPTGMVSDPVTAGEKEPQRTVSSSITVETGDTIGVSDTKVEDNNNQVKSNSMESKEQLNKDRLKCAAITALSAAAVKAKLLADQEEDQIRELVALLIDKQLHKMEMKLALFTEMESGIMRVREQLERARQRLFHERAQIIAARLGLPAPQPRSLPPSIPTGRNPPNYLPSASKPPTTTSLKPSVSKNLSTSNPPSSMSPPSGSGTVDSTPAQT